MAQMTVDVAIIGAGSAGLSAVSQIKKKTDNYIIVNDGPYGTTCARVGCMPSKVFINVANDFHRRRAFAQTGINGAESLSVDTKVVMEHVRGLRDRFVRGVMSGASGDPERNLAGFAKFVEPNLLDVSGQKIRAKAVVIATGTSPVIPTAWREGFGEYVLTTDEFFELPELPNSVAVAGVGVIGLELGQAMARLGVEVHAVNRSAHIAGLTDPKIMEYAIAKLGEEFNLVTGQAAELEASSEGVSLSAGDKTVKVEKVLASLGRRPNLHGLGLENIGVTLDASGHPDFDRNTMQIQDLPIYYTGDVNNERQLLHEAADEGRIAGYNALEADQACFRRRTPLAICFSDPNIAVVGKSYQEVEELRPVIGEVSFEGQGRALSMVKNKGLLRVYACRETGKLLGAEMIAPSGEHLAHLIAWMIEVKADVFDVLRKPFYHPVVEEGLRTALREIANEIGGPKNRIELARCEESEFDKALC